MYMIKLDHMVDDKLHARATGPYSLKNLLIFDNIIFVIRL